MGLRWMALFDVMAGGLWLSAKWMGVCLIGVSVFRNRLIIFYVVWALWCCSKWGGMRLVLCVLAESKKTEMQRRLMCFDAVSGIGLLVYCFCIKGGVYIWLYICCLCCFGVFVGVAINVFALRSGGCRWKSCFVMMCLRVFGFVVVKKTSVLYIEKTLYKTDVFYNHIT